MNTNDSRLAKQIEFIVEIDKLKQVYRRTWLTDESATRAAAGTDSRAQPYDQRPAVGS